MPLIGWDAFLDTHYRPFLIEAEIRTGRLPSRFEDLQKLLRALSPSGNYAMYRI